MMKTSNEVPNNPLTKVPCILFHSQCNPFHGLFIHVLYYFWYCACIYALMYHVTSWINHSSINSTCLHPCIKFCLLSNITYWLKEQHNSLVLRRWIFALLHGKCALLWEGSDYPRNRICMGVSISVLAHIVIKRTIQFIVSLNLFLRVSYKAAAVAVNGLKVNSLAKIKII